VHRIKIALAGTGGFGSVHAGAVLRLVNEGLVRIVAFAEPDDSCAAASPLNGIGVPRYRDYREMLDSENDLQLVSIAAPAPCQYSMAKAALERGLHVFLEKPPAITIQHFRELAALQQRTGGICAINFHDVAAPLFVALKRRLCEGVVGPVRAIRAVSLCRRADAHDARNAWAGLVRCGDEWTFDGPLATTGAHLLNTALFLADSEPHDFARPVSVQAELYRAKPIACEDTSCLRAALDTGAELCVHLTHCAPQDRPRAWTIIGADGVIAVDDVQGARLPNGDVIPPEEFCPPTATLMRRLVEVILESDEPLLMPLAEAEGYVLLVNGAYESARRIVPIPRDAIVPNGDATLIAGIGDVMDRGMREGKLFSETGAPWAVSTAPWELREYASFPSRWIGDLE